METMTNDVTDLVFEVQTPAELSVNTVSGRVSVRAGEGNQIRVHATKQGSDKARDNTQVDVQQEGNRVVIQTRAESNDMGGRFFSGKNMSSVDYDIVVPRDCEVQVKTVSADVIVRGTARRAQIQAVSGDVRVEDIDAPCGINTVSGDVVAANLSGALTLHTTSGDARVVDSRLHDFNLHSVSGDFSIETPLMRGQHYFAKTVSGDLRIAVPDGTGVTVQMRSISGDVVSDFPNAEIIKSGRRHWQGRINGGGANVEMESVSGDLRITRSSAGSSIPPNWNRELESDTAPQEAGDGEESRDRDASAVLELLEQGEISVEEALGRLRNVGR